MGVEYSPAPLFNQNIVEGLATYLKKNPTSLEELFELADVTKRHLYILDEIDEATGSAIESSIRYFNYIDQEQGTPIEDRIPIKIFINTYGGDLLAAFTMVDAIRLSTTPVWVINQGKAYSAGFLIFICGHKRLSLSTSSFLFHEGSIFTGGDAHKFDSGADFYKKQREMMKNLILEQTKISEEEYKEHKKDDWWLTTPEAIELGIADQIIDKDLYYSL